MGSAPRRICSIRAACASPERPCCMTGDISLFPGLGELPRSPAPPQEQEQLREGRAGGAKHRNHPSPPLPLQGHPREVIPGCREHEPGEPPPLQTVAPVWSFFPVAAASPSESLRNPLRDLTSPFLSPSFFAPKTISLAQTLCNPSINTSCGSKLKGNRNNYAGIRSLKL